MAKKKSSKKRATDLVGRCFVWEPRSPHAMCSIVVVAVRLNADREWWVESADLVTGKLCWNDLSRFDEATRLAPASIGELVREGTRAGELGIPEGVFRNAEDAAYFATTLEKLQEGTEHDG